MADLPQPKRPPEVGECIYCGSQEEPLSKEHAVPYGLNGPWTLLRATCALCADITHRFERDCLRGLFGSARIALAMQTRRPGARPQELPLHLEFGGERRKVLVRREEFPLYLPTPTFPAPGVVSGSSPRPMERGDVSLSFRHLSGPTFEAAGEKYGADFAGVRLNFEPQDFARMLAKVALCVAVYTKGIEPFRASPIRGVVLGTDRNIGHWVGSWVLAERNEPKGLHAMKVLTSGSATHVVIRLFAQFGAPEYHVVLGTGSEFGNWEQQP